MKIASIIRARNRVKVSFDDDTFLFLNEDLILREGLYKDCEISGNQFQHLLDQSKILTAKETSFRLLAKRQHSVFELKNKLKQREFENGIIEKIIGILTELNYLNDKEFAEKFVDQKIRSGKTGINKIRQMLFKKGISRDIISDILEKKTDKIEDAGNVKALAVKKYRSISSKTTDRNKLKMKIYNHLLSKGFSMELSRNTAIEIVNELSTNNAV